MLENVFNVIAFLFCCLFYDSVIKKGIALKGTDK